MNNKSIIFFTLLFAFISLQAHSTSYCDGVDVNKACVQVFVESNTGEALKDLVVYLEPLDGQILEKNSSKLVINQEGKSFAPFVSVSQVNSAVDFVNKDDITHHIYSAGSNSKFSFQIKAGETHSTVKFNQPVEVAMGCNIHDWMSGFVLVVNTPYFTKTDAQGYANFELPPLGNYRIIVWHPQMQSLDNRLIKEENISAKSLFTFKLKEKMLEIPLQKSDDDFDFLSDYE